MDTPQVIYEDDYLMAINKPAGYVVNDSNTAHGNPTLQDWIKANYKFETSQDSEVRNGIVHRLDKPTSGVILIAKTREVFEKLQKEFLDRNIKKVYLALVRGIVANDAGKIDAKIGRLPWNKMRFGVYDGGRDAVTEYKVIQRLKDYTLLELYPKTGRTHQLRVHLKHIGNPIVSDHLYAQRKIYKSDSKIWPRLWLHAKSISFIHPITGKEMNIEAPLPQDLKLP